MIDYSQILIRKYDANWILNGDSYDGLEWLSSSEKPTQEELDALWETVKAEIDEEQKQLELNKQKTLAKLSELGIDADDLKVLGLG